jgi:hypothetical protein
LQVQCLAIGLWSHYLKIKKKKKNNIYNRRRAMCGSREKYFNEMAIHRAIENFLIFQISQPVGII